MFKIITFCDDKVLSKILWAMRDLGTYNTMSEPVPDNLKLGPNGRLVAIEEKGEPAARKRAERSDVGKRAERSDVGKKRQAHILRRGTAPEAIPALFLDYAGKHRLREADATVMREFVVGLGYAPKSYSYITTALKASGILTKKPGNKGTADMRYLISASRSQREKARRAAKKISAPPAPPPPAPNEEAGT